MDGMTGRSRGGPRHGRSAAITAPSRLVIVRPRSGWIVSLLTMGTKVIVGLLVAAVALAVLTGVTAGLWWIGEAQIPALALVYGSIAVAGCGFGLGRAGRLLGRRPRLPAGRGQVAWPSGAGRIRTGLVWEWDDPAIATPAGPEANESCP